MTSRREALIREGYERWNEGDREWILRHMAPEVEWVSPDDDPDPATYSGHEGVESFWTQWREAVGQLQFDVEEVFETGDDVLVITRRSVRGLETGVELMDQVIQVFTFREDDMCVRVREFYERNNALRAMGIEP